MKNQDNTSANNSKSVTAGRVRVVILGAGESGVGAAILAQQKGFDVFVSDFGTIEEKYAKKLTDLSIAFEGERHTESLVLNADEVIKSPGIPPSAPIVKRLLAQGTSIISEIEFAKRYTTAKTVCVTGSNGKTTTSLLIHHILKEGGLNVGLAGNIGNSFAEQVATKQFDWYVLELSSFMLDDMYDFRADIAVLLNITPDHLDRYDYKLENYAASKMRIIQNQTPADYFIYSADDIETKNALEKVKPSAKILPFSIEHKVEEGAYLENENINIQIASNNKFTMSINELALQGKHNLCNSMAGGIVGRVLEIRKESIRESMGNFKNVPHRLEYVAKISGIDFINDSKATNINSTWYALESINADIVLIMGGVDKGNDYEQLRDMVKSKVKAIICLGKDNKRIHDAFEDDVEIIVNTFSASEAAQIAYHIAKRGDTVILSPACASFDLFKNYEDRGDQFKAAVREL